MNWADIAVAACLLALAAAIHETGRRRDRRKPQYEADAGAAAAAKRTGSTP